MYKPQHFKLDNNGIWPGDKTLAFGATIHFVRRSRSAAIDMDVFDGKTQHFHRLRMNRSLALDMPFSGVAGNENPKRFSSEQIQLAATAKKAPVKKTTKKETK